MAKTIYTLLVLSLISFSCSTTASLKASSKYPSYTVSQAQLLVDTGKCKLVKGTLNEFYIAEGRGDSRVYETSNLDELYNAIDTYIELDGANAFVLVQRMFSGYVYGFTTMSCTE